MTDPTTRDPAAVAPLLHCPFCGRAPSLSVEGVAGDGITSPFYIRCLPCAIKLEAPTREAVTAKWNRRDAAPALLAEIESLRAQLAAKEGK